MLKILAVCWVCLLAGLGSAVAESEAAPRSVTDAVGEPLFRDLLAFVSLHSGYPIAPTHADPPSLSFSDPGDVVMYLDDAVTIRRDMNGLYDPQRRHIYLVRPWSLVKHADQAVLLHELMHDVQLWARDWPCPQALEMEAHMVQHEFLAGRGLDSGFDFNVIAKMATCPGD